MAFGTLAPIALFAHAWRANGGPGFPLDDAWIHLNYARTLREHGTFAYFPGAPPSAGSTAPLFALLEAVGFWLTSNEKLIAVGLGLAAEVAFLVVFARSALKRLGDARWAALAVALAGLDGRVALLSVSGMETSLFMALIVLAVERRLAGRAIQAGLALGAALWVRPGALILAAVLAIDALLGPTLADEPERARRGRTARPVVLPTPAMGRRSALMMLGAFTVAALGYVAFNVACGGRPLPATFAAKTAYYAARPRLAFITGDIAECFGSGAWRLLAVFALVPIARELIALVRGRGGGPYRLAGGWAVGLPLAYLILLPYSHRFTRYLVPALAPLAILATAGLREVSRLPRIARARPLLLAGLLLVAAGLHAALLFDSAGLYAFACRYTAERNEVAGHWLAEHTPAGAVVATHDVGAIAFYSRRAIVDAAGLVSREVTPWIGKPYYADSLTALFDRRGVTHVAAFEEWLLIGGVPPLVVFNREPEVMRIFPWIRGRTAVLPGPGVPAR